MGTKNVFKGSVGMVAENATVGSIVVGDGATVDVNADKRKLLAVHLDALQRQVGSAPTEINRIEDSSLIEQAREQVSASDESGAWATLKKVSAWTLGVARDIGVDIAAAVVRQQAGLP